MIRQPRNSSLKMTVCRHYHFYTFYLLLIGSTSLHGEDTFPISIKYTSDLTMNTRSRGAGTSERLRNEAGTIFDSWGDASTTDRDPRSNAVDTTTQRASYGLVNRSRGSISARISMAKVRINPDRTDSISSLTVTNRATQSDWVVFRDRRNIEDDTTPFEVKVIYTLGFLSGNTGTATAAFEEFSTSFLFEDDDNEQQVEHLGWYRRSNGQVPTKEGFGTFEETFTLLPGERFRISWESDAEAGVGFRLADDATAANGTSRTIAGGGSLSWSVRLEAPDYIVQSISKSGHQWLGRQAAPRSGASQAGVERFSIKPGQRKVQAVTTPGATYRVFASEDLSSLAPVGFPAEAVGASTTFLIPEEFFAAKRGFFWVEEVSPAGP